MMNKQKKLLKQTMEKEEAKWAEARISGAAFAVWIFFMIVSALIGISLDQSNPDQVWLIVDLFILNFVGLYLLFALRVADQWERAVVLRLGKFMGKSKNAP